MFRTVPFHIPCWLPSLVLAVLSACQSVSSATDQQQVEQLDATLQALNQFQVAATLTQLDRMGEQVDIQGATTSDLLKQALALRARTAQESQYLHQLRQRLRAQASPAAARSATVLLQPGGRNAADTLRARLRAYNESISQYLPEARGTLGLDTNEDLDIQSVSGNRLDGQSFGQFYFGGNTAAGSAAMLTLHEQQVLRLEQDALAKLMERVGPGGLFFDKISAFAVPDVQRVRAGEPYRAKLFLASSSPNVKQLTMKVNGAAISLDPHTGKGQVSFPVPADAPAGPASWEGSIHGVYHGQPVSFPLRVPYQIEAP